jgi:hypothetical protein
MNRDDRTKFLALIEEKAPALLAGVDREHVTDDTIMLLVGEAMTPAPVVVAGQLVEIPGAPEAAGASPEVLTRILRRERLVYHGHEQVETEERGMRRKVWRATTRPLTAADVLGSRDLGHAVRFTAADGRRYELAT